MKVLSERKRTGGPAFPVMVANPTSEVDDGMSLRDYFAGQALVGFISCNPSIVADLNAQQRLELYAVVAYRMAAAMLIERENGNLK